jgi:hypothetical protein
MTALLLAFLCATLHCYFQESSLLAQIFQAGNNPVFGFLCAPSRPSASSAVKGFWLRLSLFTLRGEGFLLALLRDSVDFGFASGLRFLSCLC